MKKCTVIYLSLTGFVLSLALSLGFFYRADYDQHRRQKVQIAMMGQTQVRALQGSVQHALESLRLLATPLEQGDGSVQGFESLAYRFIESRQGLSSFVLAPGGVVEGIYPLDGRGAKLGRDLLAAEGGDEAAARALQSRNPVISGPVELPQGPVLVLHYPIFLVSGQQLGAFWGFATAQIRVDDLLKSCDLNRNLAGLFNFELWADRSDADARQLIAHTSSKPSGDVMSFRVNIPGARWHLQMSAKDSSLPPLLLLGILVSLSVSVLIAALVYLALYRPELLRRLVEQRTRELQKLNERLQVEVMTRMKAEAELTRHQLGLEALVSKRTRELEGVYKAFREEVARRWTAHKARRSTEKRYRLLFKSLTQGVVCYDREGLMLEANPAAERLLGVENEELMRRVSGGSQWQMIDQEGQLLSPSEMPSAVCARTGKAVKGVVVGIYCPRSKGYRWFLCNAVPEKGAGGMERIWVTFGDISEIKQAREALEKSEASYQRLAAQFQALLDGISDSILLLSPDLEVLWANQGARKFMVTRQEDTESTSTFPWRSSDDSAHGTPLLRTLLSGEPHGMEHMAADGSGWDVRTFSLPEGGVVEVARNITKNIRLKAEAMRATQLAVLGELAVGVAHEINNPINGIINYAQLLTETKALSEPQKKMAEEIISAGSRIANIVRELLRFARVGGEEMQPVQIDEVLRASLRLTGAQLERDGIRVELDDFSTLPSISGQGQRIQQVVLNLIHNARHALNQKYPGAHPDKCLEIRCEQEKIGKPRLRLSFWDHGTGIRPALLTKVLTPFFSTKSENEGTGLGLSISQGIIREHGGELWIESTEGQYTRVVLELLIEQPETLIESGFEAQQAS